MTEVTIEHIPKTLSPSGKLDSAPKDFSVYVSTRLHSVFESTFVSCIREWNQKKMKTVHTLADSLTTLMDLLFRCSTYK